MKKSYQKPEVWVETFIMDASIAAGGCSDNAQAAINQEILEMYNEAREAGISEADFNATLGVPGGTYCYNTLTNPLSTYSMS